MIKTITNKLRYLPRAINVDIYSYCIKEISGLGFIKKSIFIKSIISVSQNYLKLEILRELFKHTLLRVVTEKNNILARRLFILLIIFIF